MTAPDVPKQYKKFTDSMTLALANAGDAIWAIVSELGCTKFVCSGNKVEVTVMKQRDSDSTDCPACDSKKTIYESHSQARSYSWHYQYCKDCQEIFKVGWIG